MSSLNLKICLISSSFPRFVNGNPGVYQGSFVYELAQYLGQRGHQVYVVTPLYPDAPAYEVQEGIAIYRFRFYGWQQGWVLAQLKPIPLLSMVSYLVATIWLARRVIKEHKVDIIHAYWVIPAGFSGVLLRWLTGVPVVATAPGSDLNIWPRRWLPRQLVRFTLSRLDVLFTLGNDLRDVAVSLGASPEKVVVNLGDGGMNLDLLQPPHKREQTRQGWGVSEDGSVILFVGSLHPPKRVDHLIIALKQVVQEFPMVCLNVVGSGSQEAALHQLRDQLGLEQVIHFLGYKPHEVVPELLEAADLFVYPSDSEGLPSAIMEAQAMGVPVVASRVGGIPDLIEPGKTGLLVEPGDVEGLALALISLLHNHSLARQIGDNAQTFARSKLDKEVIMPRIEEGYRQALYHLEDVLAPPEII